MTKLLALETSGTSCSVAIHADGMWAEDTQNVQRLHNQVLLQQIDGLVRRTGARTRAFDVIAFGAGPGSFTGIRIAAATAQALAFASGGLVVPVPSSLALADTAWRSGRAQGSAGIVTVIRSRRDAHYIAAYARQGEVMQRTQDDALHQGLEEPDLRSVWGWVGFGDRPPWWDDARRSAPFHEDCAVTAVTIGRLALAIHSAGGAVAPEAGLPIYVSGDSPWKPHAARYPLRDDEPRGDASAAAPRCG